MRRSILSLYAGFIFTILFISTNLMYAQWVQTNGSYNGRITSFAFSAKRIGGVNLFVGTFAPTYNETAGVFLSTDNGSSWTPIYSSLMNYGVSSLVIDTNGTDSFNLFAGTGNGVYLSTNNGTSWTAVDSGFTNLRVYSLTLNGSDLFAVTKDGLYLSRNNGTNWKQVNSTLVSNVINCLTFIGTNLFAGTDFGGVYLSTDNGTSWTQINSGLIPGSLSRIPYPAVSSFAVIGTNLFAGTDNGVFLSTNNGTSWLVDSSGIGSESISSLAVVPNGKGGTNLFAGTYPTSFNENGGVYLSTNNGTSWMQVNSGLTNHNITALFVCPDSSGYTNLFAATHTGPGDDGGLFLTTNNGTDWINVNSGPAFTKVNVSAFVVSGTNFLAGSTYGDLYLSTNNGTSWSTINSGFKPGNPISSFAVYPNETGGTNLIAGIGSYNNSRGGDGVYLSTNYGANWSRIDSGLTEFNITSLAVSPNGSGGTNIFAGTIYPIQNDYDNGGVFLSTNNGTSWTEVDSNLALSLLTTSLIVCPNEMGGTNLIAGTLDHGIYLSTNNGTSWSKANMGSYNNYSIYCLTVSPDGKGGTNVFAGGDGVFFSNDNGASWTEVNSGFPSNSVVWSLASSPNGIGSTNLFAGTIYTGVYLSTNNGTNWNAVNTGFPSNTNITIYSLAVNGPTLFAGASLDGNFPLGGVWKRPLSDMITAVDNNQNPLPSNYALSQNFPNPFNPTTTIKYSVPKAGLVTIKVYDILGREVTTLVNEQKTVGNYEVQFNAAKLASGVYFYRMQAGDFVDIKKLLLLK